MQESLLSGFKSFAIFVTINTHYMNYQCRETCNAYIY